MGSHGSGNCKETHRLRRLLAFLDPFQDAHNSGYQRSIASCDRIRELFGVGIGAEANKKCFYLPEAHNDFYHAAVLAEMGFVGISLVMLLFSFSFGAVSRIIIGQKSLRSFYSFWPYYHIVDGRGIARSHAVVMGVAPPKGRSNASRELWRK